MDRLGTWEALCRQRTAARWEQDAACMAITAKLVASLKPSPMELDRWQRACERSSEVDHRMRRYASAEFVTAPAPPSSEQFCPGASIPARAEMDDVPY